MSPPVVLNIEFENKIGYPPGNIVNGQVEMILKKKLPIKAITVYAKGISEVKFKKFVFPGKFVSVSEDEEFYTKVLPVFGSNLGSSHNFTKGTYRYSFSFDIPEDVPYSFESKYGYVRHFCKAIVEIDNPNFGIAEFPILFNVLPLLDLNLEQSAKTRIQYSGEKNIWYLCGKAGFVSMILNIGKSGFTHSEKNIVIDAECTNGSTRPSVTKAELFQIVTYRADGRAMTRKKLISSKSHPEIGPGNDDVWSNETLLVPQLPPSELRGSRLIDIQYKFKFKLIPTGLANGLKVSFPIMIGTIPLLPQESSSPEANTSSHPSNPYFVDSAPTAPPMPQSQESRPQKVISISLTSGEDTNLASGNSLSIQC